MLATETFSCFTDLPDSVLFVTHTLIYFEVHCWLTADVCCFGNKGPLNFYFLCAA